MQYSIPYSHLSNNRGGWNKRGGVQKLQNQLHVYQRDEGQNGRILLVNQNFLIFQSFGGIQKLRWLKYLILLAFRAFQGGQKLLKTRYLFIAFVGCPLLPLVRRLRLWMDPKENNKQSFMQLQITNEKGKICS